VLKKQLIILFGPTGVGKTDIAEKIASTIPAEIVNMDVGQLYSPLTIGTAKPDWRLSPIPHHLFDLLELPINYTVVDYRNQVLKTVTEILERGNTPIIVGGSGFYLHALFFPPVAAQVTSKPERVITEYTWDELYAIDPDRAAAIHKNDSYRIRRALAIWASTGSKPSHMKAPFEPLPFPTTLICLTRERSELYERINDRVLAMMKAGWVEEVERLCGTAWEQFLREKKLIGYNELIDYCCHDEGQLPELISIIQQRTRAYAKRQLAFWKMLSRKIEHERARAELASDLRLEQLNLTLMDLDLYIKQLSLKGINK